MGLCHGFHFCCWFDWVLILILRRGYDIMDFDLVFFRCFSFRYASCVVVLILFFSFCFSSFRFLSPSFGAVYTGYEG
ncbi:uncharacterized protein BDW47DRAFT_105741 [Aspergillus candidus]|uniref:Uncharacterized protein n=1 Tax=Aspergillus candidus TaxID=41067 RepID=A0A2I2FBP0_ASPCN|nr:hypothetical protein BDW47DRAFT_105741 [Aspergillus candidus]PLB38049.1 hypothetical protein BDW47DRAFT_105741 [Aspergillus candidus]